MKKTRYSEEQIGFALRQAETGTPAGEVIRKMGLSTQTFYRWKKQHGQMAVDEIRRLKQLEEENRKLKQLVADLRLAKLMLRMCFQKSSKAWSSAGVGARSRRAVRGKRTAGLSRAPVFQILAPV
jgi:putative transposase